MCLDNNTNTNTVITKGNNSRSDYSRSSNHDYSPQDLMQMICEIRKDVQELKTVPSDFRTTSNNSSALHSKTTPSSTTYHSSYRQNSRKEQREKYPIKKKYGAQHRENVNYRNSGSGDNSSSPHRNQHMVRQPVAHIKYTERARPASARRDTDTLPVAHISNSNQGGRKYANYNNYNGYNNQDGNSDHTDNNGSDEDIKIIKPQRNGRQTKSNNPEEERNHLSQQEMLRVWLTSHVQLPQYYDLFIDHGVEDLQMVMDMTINELRMLGIHTKKHQLQIQKEITKLRNSLKRRTSANLFDTV